MQTVGNIELYYLTMSPILKDFEGKPNMRLYLNSSLLLHTGIPNVLHITSSQADLLWTRPDVSAVGQGHA